MPRFIILSGHSAGNAPEKNALNHKFLRHRLFSLDFDALPVRGCYTHQDGTTVMEDSLLVPVPEDREILPILGLAGVVKQESILLDTDGEGQLLYLADGHRQPLGRRTPGVAENYTSTPLGEFHYA